MADEADRAQRINAEMYTRELSRARGKLSAAGSKDCIDCGKQIPAARVAACPSARRCVGCQQAHEKGQPPGCYSGHTWVF